MLDLVIKNGLVFDGSGKPAQRLDVGLAGTKIAVTGNVRAEASRQTLDADGLWVAPGFIDAHSHSDTYILLAPDAPSKIHQGITTEIVGNCGASAFPILGEYQLPSDWAAQSYPGTWSSFAEYRALLERVHPSVNVAALVGHNTLRAGVMGYEDREADTEELRRMCSLLAQCMEEGALGLSTGLAYPPGMFAPQAELVSLGKCVASYDGILTSHMRSESDQLLAALDEILDVARLSRVRVQVSHLKAAGRANWPLAGAAISRIEKARAEGVRVAADRYPYTASCTDLDIILPSWAEAGGRKKILERIRHPATRTRILEELGQVRKTRGWDDIFIGTTLHEENRRFRGHPLTYVASELRCSPAEAALELMDRDELGTGAIFFGMSDENMWNILSKPYVMLGTDASLRSPTGILSHDFPHPRAYGSFPRFLQAAIRGETVPPEEAIRKMTSLPADHFHLARRGRICPKYAGDIVILDPQKIRDRATYESPHQLSEGIQHVIVNGTLTLANSKPTGQQAGLFLAPMAFA